MLNIARIFIIVSILGLISCTPDQNSSKNVEKVIFVSDNFKLPQPTIYSVSNNKTFKINSKSVIAKSLSIFDEIEFETSQISYWEIETTCFQNKQNYKAKIELSLKPRFFIYEFLPPKLIQKMKNQEINCNWDINVKNSRGSTDSLPIHNVNIHPNNWSSQLKLLNLNSKEDIYENSQYHIEQIKLWIMILNPEIQNDEVSLQCQGLDDLRGSSYRLELSNLTWEDWLKKIDNKSWFKTSCQIFTWQKNRITSWSSPFYIYNPKTNFPPPIYLKKDKVSLLKFQIHNPYLKDVFLRIYKSNLKRAFSLVQGFNLFSSNVIGEGEYIDYANKKKLWMSSNQITNIFVTSTNAKLVKETSSYLLYRIVKKSKAIFQLKKARKPTCKKIYISSSTLVNTNSFVLDVLSDLNKAAQAVPFRQLTLPNMKPIKLEDSDPTNPREPLISMNKTKGYIKMINSHKFPSQFVLDNIKKNYDPNFNCQKGTY